MGCCKMHSTLWKWHQTVRADQLLHFNLVPCCPFCFSQHIYFSYLPPPSISFIVFFNYNAFFCHRLPYPFGLQHRQKRLGSSPRGLRPGQRRPVRVGVSPAHVGQRGEAPAQNRGRSLQTPLSSSHRALLRPWEQPAGRQDQRLAKYKTYTVKYVHDMKAKT